MFWLFIFCLPPSDHTGSVPERPSGVSFGQHASVPRERPHGVPPGADHSALQHHHHRPVHWLRPRGERPGRDVAPPHERAELSDHGQPPRPAGKQRLTPPECPPPPPSYVLHTCTTALGPPSEEGAGLVCASRCWTRPKETSHGRECSVNTNNNNEPKH